MEIALGVAALLLGLVAGLAIGGWRARRTDNPERRADEERQKEKAHQRELTDKNDVVEQLRARLVALESRASELSSRIEELEAEGLRYRRWLGNRFKQMNQQLLDSWADAGLPRRLHQMSKPLTKRAENALPMIASIADRMLQWMNELDSAAITAHHQLALGSAEVYHQLGLWHAIEGRMEDAASCFQEAVAKGGMVPESSLALGESLWTLGRTQKARVAYRAATHGKNIPDHVLLRIATAAAERRQFKDVFVALEPLLHHKKNPVEVYILASLACQELDDPARATEICAAGLRQHGESVELMARMIVPLSRIGKPERATEVYQRAVELDPNMPEVPFEMGIVNMDLGQDKEAIGYFEQAVALKAEYPEALFALGTIQNRRGKPKTALKLFKRATRMKPDYAEAYYHMKDSYESLKDFDNAIAMLNKATKLNPDYR